jgi:hypothetical protein
MAKKKPVKKTKAKAPAKKAAVKKAAAPKKKAANASKSVRRPSQTPNIPSIEIAKIETKFQEIKTSLEEYAANLRALDRKRLNGVGMKLLGFISRAYEYAQENPEFFPHYLTMSKFTQDRQYFNMLRICYDTSKLVEELLWNMIMEASDMLYTDALEYYASVREASKRRIDPSEAIFNDLKTFFKRGKSPDAPETEKELLKDAKAIIRGKKDGKFEVLNISPKLIRGVHKVIDEKFTDTAKYKDTEDGEIKE